MISPFIYDHFEQIDLKFSFFDWDALGLDEIELYCIFAESQNEQLCLEAEWFDGDLSFSVDVQVDLRPESRKVRELAIINQFGENLCPISTIYCHQQEMDSQCVIEDRITAFKERRFNDLLGVLIRKLMAAHKEYLKTATEVRD